jgi:hypothetical protein
MKFWLIYLSSPRGDSKDHLSISGSAALNEHIRTDDRSIMVFNGKPSLLAPVCPPRSSVTALIPAARQTGVMWLIGDIIWAEGGHGEPAAAELVTAFDFTGSAKGCSVRPYELAEIWRDTLSVHLRMAGWQRFLAAVRSQDQRSD